jgi:hypothetical protein
MKPSGGGLSARDHTAPSVFTAANLLREARRQRRLPDLPVPAVCLLDPDGDVVRHLAAGTAQRHPGWACYHYSARERTGRNGSAANGNTPHTAKASG